MRCCAWFARWGRVSYPAPYFSGARARQSRAASAVHSDHLTHHHLGIVQRCAIRMDRASADNHYRYSATDAILRRGRGRSILPWLVLVLGAPVSISLFLVLQD